HHQAAGVLTKEAFRAAADTARFPELSAQGLRPWQARKLFTNPLRAPEGTPGIFTISEGTGAVIKGRSVAEIGFEARVMHRSQGMGGGGQRRPFTASFRLWDSALPDQGTGQDLFAGVDLTLNRFTTLAGGSPAVGQRVQAVQRAIEAARDALPGGMATKALPALADGLEQLRNLRAEVERSTRDNAAKADALFLLGIKEADFVKAIILAGGVEVRALADRAELVAGETFQITAEGLRDAPESPQISEITLAAPKGWRVKKIAEAGRNSSRVKASFQVTVPGDSPVSQPYWLVKARSKDYFATLEVPWVGTAWNPALVRANFRLLLKREGHSVPITYEVDVVKASAGSGTSERGQPLAVVPPIGVWIEPRVAIFPLRSGATQVLQVKLRNNTSAEKRATARLKLPPGWSSNPPARSVVLANKGEEASVQFEVSAPRVSSSTAEAERLTVQAIAQVGQQSFSTGYQVIAYPHIPTRYWFQPSLADFLRLDVKTSPGLRVGYVMGTGDSVPEALQQLGVSVELMSAEELANQDLGKFDAIVTGIRAYEVRKDLAANHERLMDYVNNGGVMIVQYSRPLGNSPPLGPYPLNLGNTPRVTVEDAPINILEPAHPIFHLPNEINQEDFEGWFQERGAYFMESWGPEYRPLLESHDPGEPPQKGGMLFAPHGKGFYIFTAYLWSRQLPAGVPGAYRIFANMVSLGKTARQNR
ncbi:MAG: hypothetical protein HY648_10000, partial [Acidobacteria bacterium]|nr:hypothetical protein [Acidobacteriota bacterium]